MPATEDAVGVINPDELYTLKAFTRRLGIKAATLRSARRAGLKVYYAHKQAYVHGRDWIEYVLQTANQPSTAATSQRG
jgi:hypothetical protein